MSFSSHPGTRVLLIWSCSVRMRQAPYKTFSPSKLSQQSQRSTSTVGHPILAPTPLGSPLYLHVGASGALPSRLCISPPKTPGCCHCHFILSLFLACIVFILFLARHPASSEQCSGMPAPPMAHYSHTSPLSLSQMASPQTAPQHGKKQGAPDGVEGHSLPGFILETLEMGGGDSSPVKEPSK